MVVLVFNMDNSLQKKGSKRKKPMVSQAQVGDVMKASLEHLVDAHREVLDTYLEYASTIRNFGSALDNLMDLLQAGEEVVCVSDPK